MKQIYILLFYCLQFIPNLLTAQNEPINGENETPDDPYIHVPREGRATASPYGFNTTGFSIRQVNVDESGQNILGDAANEPSMAIDPVYPTRMAIGWRQFDTISSNFRQAGYAFSTDAGENWIFPEPIEPGIFRSDPVLDVDTEGNLYYNSLTNTTGDYICHVFKSDAGTTSWDEGTFAYGGDKQWMVVDRTENTSKGNIYCFWKTGISSCSPGAFTRSLNNGLSYEPCETFPDDPTRGTLAIGPGGELYACGGTGDNFAVLKSANPGVQGQALTWDFSVILDLGGPLALYNGPNPTGMLGQAWIAVDHSGSDTHGNVYLLGTIANISTGDPADVVFTKSTDGGLTWSTPLRLHDDLPGNWQWFGSMSVAPNGRIDVTWLDTRDHPGTYLSRLYYSYSEDGGNTWTPGEALSDAFDPHLGFPQQTKIGDYYHQLSDDTGAHLAWSATFNGEEDIFYSYIQPELINTAAHQPASSIALTCAPNPFNQTTAFSFFLPEHARIKLEIFDGRGLLTARLADSDLDSGEHKIAWQTDVPAGLYSYRLSMDGIVSASGRVVKVY